MAEPLVVTCPDGRSLEVLLGGVADPDAPVLVHHHGTPQAAHPFTLLDDAAVATGLRTVSFSRPGYGRSTPAPAPRPVADGVADTLAVLDHLGIGEFVTLGWSGGGPHALACAALAAPRCRAATSGVGVAPHVGFPGDFLAGMGEENLVEFGAAFRGEEALRALLEEWRPGFLGLTGADVVTSMGDLLPEVDRAALTGELAEELAATFRHAVAAGVSGWLHDDLAFVAEWGFDPSDIAVPVAIWQGLLDRMVPLAHAERLAALIPHARVHLTPEEGHLSLLHRLPEILAELRALAGL
ncbi:alpha/beta fold hydrolase [Nocardioides sp.]|uniref:alpha/beta fold hydrolase n=1 Tax=Nocardioides sp. TaxID=35761 RepID=UPI003515D179